MLSRLDALVEPHREALSVALGLASGEPPESFLVALAALNLLAQAAEGRPLLCIVDDVQWLDQATAGVLGFVARRLLAEPVGLVFAARTTTASDDPLAGLPDLRLSGLDEQSARALLASVTTGRIDESVRRRIVEEAHGNPLALRELGVVDFAGGFAMPDSVSVPRRIEDQYLMWLRGLPRVTQRLLLVAAADPVGDRVLLARAAHTLNLDFGALEVAVDAGLLDIGAGVRASAAVVRPRSRGHSWPTAMSPTSCTTTPSNCFPAPAWFLTSRGHDCVTANGCGATSSYRRCHAVATRLR